MHMMCISLMLYRNIMVNLHQRAIISDYIRDKIAENPQRKVTL
jgi:hypothetical protein